MTPAKPFKQKGSGNARQGSRKGTQFRKGGVVFGPVVRDQSHDLTKKFRKLGLKTALSAKAKEGNLVVVDEAKLSAPKTKDLKSRLDACGLKIACLSTARKLMSILHWPAAISKA